MVDDKSIVNDFTDDDLDLASMHSPSSSESEGDALEGDNSLETCCNSGATNNNHTDRIPSTNPDAEPPRDARDSGSARSHSTHLETSSSDRP